MPKRFPLEFLDEVPEHLIEEFQRRHSISVLGWRNFLDQDIHPVFDAIADKPRFERPQFRAAEWDLHRLHEFSSLDNWAMYKHIGEYFNFYFPGPFDRRMSMPHVAFFNFLTYPRQFFEGTWRILFVRNVPLDDWVAFDIPDTVSSGEHHSMISLENEIASHMTRRLGLEHKCRVELLFESDFSLPVDKRGIYWIIYPEACHEAFTDTFRAGQFGVLRPAYEIVIFQPYRSNQVRVFHRGLIEKVDEILDLWMRGLLRRKTKTHERIPVPASHEELHNELDSEAGGLWWHGRLLGLSSNQYLIVDFFHDAISNGKPVLQQSYLLGELEGRLKGKLKDDIKSKTIRDVFKRNIEAYNLIFEHDNSGRYWIKGTYDPSVPK